MVEQPNEVNFITDNLDSSTEVEYSFKNVTMDSFVLDITNVKNKKLKEGDYICLLENSNFEYILKNINLISYELLTLMGERIRREY